MLPKAGKKAVRCKEFGGINELLPKSEIMLWKHVQTELLLLNF